MIGAPKYQKDVKVGKGPARFHALGFKPRFALQLIPMRLHWGKRDSAREDPQPAVIVDDLQYRCARTVTKTKGKERKKPLAKRQATATQELALAWLGSMDGGHFISEMVMSCLFNRVHPHAWRRQPPLLWSGWAYCFSSGPGRLSALYLCIYVGTYVPNA